MVTFNKIKILELLNHNNIMEIKSYCMNLEKYDTTKKNEYNLGKKEFGYNPLGITSNKKIYNFDYIYSLPHHYKSTNYYNLYNFMADVLLDEFKNKLSEPQYYVFFFQKISTINKGQHILKKLKPILIEYNFFNTSFTSHIRLTAASRGTLPTFLFWDNNLLKDHGSFNTSILIDSCNNTDSRILYYILNNYKKYGLENIMTRYIFIKMIQKLNYPYIPIKYFKKRLYKISQVFNIAPYWKLLPYFCGLE